MRGGALRGDRRRLKAHLFSTAAAGVLLSSTLAACDLGDDRDTPSSTTPVTPSSGASDPGADQAIRISSVGDRPKQVGRADVAVTEESVEGGTIRSVEGPTGEPAFGFPPYRPTGAYPRAVLVVTNAGSTDEMNPGTRAFRWGADFRVAVRSSGRIEDNGDNLIQRGLYSEPSLFKAELDLDRPACVVRGADGMVTIRSDAIIPGLWYHMECHRDGLQVKVTVWPLSDPDSTTTRIGIGPTGDVTPVAPDVPISVGGKVAQDGSIIESATDQMNGDLANPFVEIAGH